MMNIEYDKDADAAYIYMVHPIKDGQSTKRVRATDDVIVNCII